MKVIEPVLSPAAASVSFSSRGGSWWLRGNCGGCGAGSVSLFELLHGHFSNHYIIVILKHCTEDYCDSILFRLNIHGLTIPLTDKCTVLSFSALILGLEAFLKDRGKTI